MQWGMIPRADQAKKMGATMGARKVGSAFLGKYKAL
jgi:hypothetical protein